MPATKNTRYIPRSGGTTFNRLHRPGAPQCTALQTDRQTDRQTDGRTDHNHHDANSRSYCVTVQSVKTEKID